MKKSILRSPFDDYKTIDKIFDTEEDFIKFENGWIRKKIDYYFARILGYTSVNYAYHGRYINEQIDSINTEMTVFRRELRKKFAGSEIEASKIILTD
jgi:hypothetical protein